MIASLASSVLLGVVEGLTEFLPISSTGHLIVVGELVGRMDEKDKAFHIFIQLGAVLAVVWNSRRTLGATARGLSTDASSRRFVAAVALAFLPAAVVGLLLHRWIEARLFSSQAVAAALIAGGVAILAVEALVRRRAPARHEDARSIPLTAALLIGLAQVLALYPGVSRSAATILSGMLVGLSRRAATEFSFYLAIPTLGAACLYSLVGIAPELTAGDLADYGAGLLAALLTAALVLRWFLGWVQTHDLRPFAWYRLVLGIAVLLVAGNALEG